MHLGCDRHRVTVMDIEDSVNSRLDPKRYPECIAIFRDEALKTAARLKAWGI